MLPTRHLVEFLLTVYVLILIPGPSVLFVVSRGVALGRRAALATVAGNASGFALQLLLVSIGVGSIVARSDAVFTTLKLLGAAYLVFLGVRNIRERKALAALFAPAVAAEPKPLRRIVREGFFVGATNPKGVIIFTAVLPQFIDRSRVTSRSSSRFSARSASASRCSPTARGRSPRAPRGSGWGDPRAGSRR